jgi:3-oxoacyl-[acyl-carrier protein] reductase
MDLNLDGKRALVTGGARGIGRAIALALASEGATVIAGHRRPSESAEKLAQDLAPSGGHVVMADVSSAAGADTLLAECEAKLGGLDVVVNSAGITAPPYDRLDLDTWNAHLDINLTGTHLVIQRALPLLRDGASIVNISSGLAFVGMPNCAAYGASKAGLTGLTRSLIRELGDRKIRVNVISPGLVETDMTAGQPSEHHRRFAAASALHRVGRPWDIAAVAVFLASPASAFVNGVTLPVDGGV